MPARVAGSTARRRVKKKKKKKTPEIDPDATPSIAGTRALFCLKDDNTFRQRVLAFSYSKHWSNFILFLICLNLVAMMADDPIDVKMVRYKGVVGRYLKTVREQIQSRQLLREQDTG